MTSTRDNNDFSSSYFAKIDFGHWCTRKLVSLHYRRQFLHDILGEIGVAPTFDFVLRVMRRFLQKRLPKMTGHFRSNVWDPVLIISQIIAMQSQFYLLLGVWNYLMNMIGSFDSSLDKVFTETDLDVLETSGRLNVIAFLLNSLTSALALWFIVQRSKLCLDFSATTHLFHLVACLIYNRHIPNSLPWWVINVISIALMTVTGEFLCMRTEMKAIPLSMGPKADLW